MRVYYNPEVRYLLIRDSDEKLDIVYASRPDVWKAPLIGPRPPFYIDPRYTPYMPII